MQYILVKPTEVIALSTCWVKKISIIFIVNIKQNKYKATFSCYNGLSRKVNNLLILRIYVWLLHNC